SLNALRTRAPADARKQLLNATIRLAHQGMIMLQPEALDTACTEIRAYGTWAQQWALCSAECRSLDCLAGRPIADFVPAGDQIGPRTQGLNAPELEASLRPATGRLSCRNSPRPHQPAIPHGRAVRLPFGCQG